MTFNFTKAHWNIDINTPAGNQKGFVIQYAQYQIGDPIIQAYQDHGNGEFELKANRVDFIVTILNNDIVISSENPFDGKLIIK